SSVEARVDERRSLPCREALVPLKRRSHTVILRAPTGRVREAVIRSVQAGSLDRGIEDSRSSANHSLRSDLVSKAESWPPSAGVVEQVPGAFAPRARSQEAQRAQIPARGRVCQRRIEAGQTIMLFICAHIELIPDSEIHGQTRRDLPV